MSSGVAATVRLASADDAADVGRLLHDFNSEFSQPTPGAAALAERLPRLLAGGDAVILLAGDGPDGIALIRFRRSIWTDAIDAYLEELYVAPAERGRGLGRALLDAAIETARQRGATSWTSVRAKTTPPPRPLREQRLHQPRGRWRTGDVRLRARSLACPALLR